MHAELKTLKPGSPEYRTVAERLLAEGAICPGWDCPGCRQCDGSSHIPTGPVAPEGHLNRAGGVTSNQFGTFRNHDASDAQVAFVARLRAERGLAQPAGERLTKKAASRLIEELLETPKTAAAPKVDPNRRSNRYPGTCTDCGTRVAEEAGWIENVGGKWVTHHADGECVEATAKAAPTAQVTEDGMYQNPDTLEVYKVQVAHHGSGNLYAKRLVVTDGKGRFEYAPGAIKTIDPAWKMDLNQATAFGQLYGICCNCAAVLTDEKSIAAGIGPVCATRF